MVVEVNKPNDTVEEGISLADWLGPFSTPRCVWVSVICANLLTQTFSVRLGRDKQGWNTKLVTWNQLRGFYYLVCNTSHTSDC